MVNKNSKLAKIFIPTFNELTIFCMSYTVIFLFLVNEGFKQELSDLFIHPSDPRSFILPAMLTIGIILSLYHVFTKRKKKWFEKLFMLLFVVLMNFIAGWYGFFYALFHNSNTIPIIFPAWNFIYGSYLLALTRSGILKIDSVADENAPFYLVIISLILLSIIIIICQLHFQLYWAFTFSISLSYLSTINNSIVNMIKTMHSLKKY